MRPRRGTHAQCVQRLAVMVAVMASRERRAPTAGRRSPRRSVLAAALGALPSGVLMMVAEAVAALGHADVPGVPPRACERPAAPAAAPHARKRRRA
jgi:hypothetical protein